MRSIHMVKQLMLLISDHEAPGSKRQTSAYVFTVLHCTGPLIVTLSSSLYDLKKNVERDIKH